MTSTNAFTFAAIAISASATFGCASKPSAPFDAMPTANVTAFRLQNYERPAAAPAAATPAPGVAGIPGLPPEINQWVQAGAQGLQQLIPPGILPPGMIPGAAAPAAVPQAQPNAPRFPLTQPNFLILGQAQVADADLKEELAEILGDEDSFDNNHASCMYAEMGLVFQTGPGQNNELLISFSCNQIQSRGFAWPHPSAGMKPDTVKKLSEVVQQLFPPGT